MTTTHISPAHEAFDRKFSMRGSGDISGHARTDVEWLRLANSKVAADQRGMATSMLLNLSPERRHDALLDLLGENPLVGSGQDYHVQKVQDLGYLLNERLADFAARLMDTEERHVLSVLADDLLDAAIFNGRVDIESESQDDWSDASHVGAILTVLAAWSELNAPAFR
jgi:hypothetical protein